MSGLTNTANALGGPTSGGFRDYSVDPDWSIVLPSNSNPSPIPKNSGSDVTDAGRRGTPAAPSDVTNKGQRPTQPSSAPDTTNTGLSWWDKAPTGLKASMDQSFQTIHGGESGGGNDYTLQNNAGSGASGPFQIMKGTYDTNFRKYFPDETQGRSDEDLWATRVDPDTYNKVAKSVMYNNAQTLSQNRIPPTPNNLTLAWRLGTDGAAKLLQAAATSPGALAGDVLPMLHSPGNEGAANVTVAQLVANPYAGGGSGRVGAGGGADTPATLFALNLGQQILSQQAAEYAKGQERVAQIDRDYKPINVPPPPKPPETDPFKQFSSLAGLFAVLAAGFSKTPAVAAMNGLAGAMNAAKTNDWEAYKAHWDQYQTQSNLAIKAQEMHSKNIHDALDMMQTNMAAGTAMMTTALTMAQDEENLKHLHLGETLEIGRRNDEVTKNMREQAELKPVVDAHAQLTAANQLYSAAVASGDQEQIAKAAEVVKQKQAAFDKASSELKELRQAERGMTLGGAAGAAEIDVETIANQRIADAEKTGGPLSDAQKAQIRADVRTELRPKTPSAAKESDADTIAHDAFVKKYGHEPDPNDPDFAQMKTDARKEAATRAPAAGTLAAERVTRFNEMKAAQQKAGTYKDDTAVYAAIDRQMTEDKQVAISDEAAKIAADIALKTGHPPAWMGRSQASLNKFLDTFAKEATAKGMTADDIAANQVKFTSEIAEARTLGTMSARVDFGAKELDVALPQALESSEKVYRPGFKKVAEIQQAVQGQTSDPDLLEFAQFNQQVISAYGQMMARGGMSTVDGMHRAESLLSTATSQTGYMRQLDTLHKEVQTILYGTAAAKEQLLQEINPSTPPTRMPTLTGVPRAGEQPSGSAYKEGDTGVSKSGKPTVFHNGRWEYQ